MTRQDGRTPVGMHAPLSLSELTLLPGTGWIGEPIYITSTDQYFVRVLPTHGRELWPSEVAEIRARETPITLYASI